MGAWVEWQRGSIGQKLQIIQNGEDEDRDLFWLIWNYLFYILIWNLTRGQRSRAPEDRHCWTLRDICSLKYIEILDYKPFV